jgi:alpha/beta superfamily hydrolase
MHAPAAAVRLVLLCHPHPLYGGSMHSPVPLAIARILAEKGQGRVAWARFNTRGVGASGGQYDEGRGEVDDARAVLGHLRSSVAGSEGARTTLCGHSFGSSVAYRAAAADGRVERLLLIAPSTRFLRFDGEPPHPAQATVFVGDRDELCDVADARALAERIGAEVRVFEGFDHHFLKSRRALAEAALSVIAPEVVSP